MEQVRGHYEQKLLDLIDAEMQKRQEYENRPHKEDYEKVENYMQSLICKMYEDKREPKYFHVEKDVYDLLVAEIRSFHKFINKRLPIMRGVQYFGIDVKIKPRRVSNSGKPYKRIENKIKLITIEATRVN